MDIFLRNIFFGFVIAMPIGPVSILIINNILKSGYFTGLLTALGAITVDSFFLLIVFFGLSKLADFMLIKWLLGLFGTVVLFYLAIQNIKDFFHTKKILIKSPSSFDNYYLQGLIINITNPLAIVSWTGIFGSIMVSTNHNYSGIMELILAFGIVVGISLWTITLTMLTNFGKKILNPKNYRYISLLSGIILLFFSFQVALKTILIIIK